MSALWSRAERVRRQFVNGEKSGKTGAETSCSPIRRELEGIRCQSLKLDDQFAKQNLGLSQRSYGSRLVCLSCRDCGASVTVNVKLDTREIRREAREAFRGAGRVALFVSAVIVLTLVVRDPLNAQFSIQQDPIPTHHPNSSYGLEFGGVRG